MSRLAEITEKVLVRKFGGKLGNKIQDFEHEHERSFEKKHLKAYLRGDQVFTWGFTKDKFGNKLPMWYIVKEIYE